MLFLITKMLLNPASILHVLVIAYILLWSLRLFENFLVLFACLWEGSVVCLLNFSFMKVLVIQLNINIDDAMNKNAQTNGCVQYHWMILLSHHIFFMFFNNRYWIFYDSFLPILGWRKWGRLHWPDYWIFWGDWSVSLFYLPLVLPCRGHGAYWALCHFY